MARVAYPRLNSQRGHCLAKARDDYHYGGMQTASEAAGGSDGLHRLAGAWHRRVMADDVVGHAFSHGFHPPACRATRSLLGRGTRRPEHVFRVLWWRDHLRQDAQRQRKARRNTTTTTMSRYHQSADDVPNGLSIPHWSRGGLQV